MSIRGNIGSNKRKTILIMICFILFFFLVSYILGRALGYGLSFAGVMLIISGLISFSSYYYSDKIVLSMSGAKPATKEEHKDLYLSIENLSIATGLPMPKIYVIDDPAPNAFATGRSPKHAAIAATTGLLAILKKSELEGVLAHELSHVKNYDTRLMAIVAILVGSLAILSDIFFRSMFFSSFRNRDSDRGDSRANGIFMILAIIMAILAPIIATLIQLAVSRKREFLADADGALITRYPEGLAAALEKIASDKHMLKHASPATAHLYFESPFKSDTKHKTSWFVGLFSTHPPVAERIRILREM
ncbi:MAG TPA: M48 family metalloprotease [Candidatus Levybacteria bacterium]|nr:M48 family metalloprotease [Candidatus Levybacteria bacterium]